MHGYGQMVRFGFPYAHFSRLDIFQSFRERYDSCHPLLLEFTILSLSYFSCLDLTIQYSILVDEDICLCVIFLIIALLGQGENYVLTKSEHQPNVEASFFLQEYSLPFQQIKLHCNFTPMQTVQVMTPVVVDAPDDYIDQLILTIQYGVYYQVVNRVVMQKLKFNQKI